LEVFYGLVSRTARRQTDSPHYSADIRSVNLGPPRRPLRAP